MSRPTTTPESAGSRQVDAQTAQFVGFRIDAQEFAFAIGRIQEIIVLNEVTPIPQVEDYVEGVTNLRGDIIPVVDLRRLFGMPPIEVDRESRVIIVNVGEKTVGCRVDAVTQVITIPTEAVEPAPSMITGDVNRYIDGFANVDGRIVVMLDSDQLLNPAKLENVRQSALSALATQESLQTEE